MTLRATYAALQSAKKAVLKPSFQFNILTLLASASYHSQIRLPNHVARQTWKERTAGSLSIDKIGDE